MGDSAWVIMPERVGISAMSGALINVTPRGDPREGLFDAVREPVTFHLVGEHSVPAVLQKGRAGAAVLRSLATVGKFLGAFGVAFCVKIFSWIVGLAMVVFLLISGGYGIMGLITKVNSVGHVALFFGAAFGCFVAIGLATMFDLWVSRLAGLERR